MKIAMPCGFIAASRLQPTNGPSSTAMRLVCTGEHASPKPSSGQRFHPMDLNDREAAFLRTSRKHAQRARSRRVLAGSIVALISLLVAFLLWERRARKWTTGAPSHCSSPSRHCRVGSDRPDLRPASRSDRVFACGPSCNSLGACDGTDPTGATAEAVAPRLLRRSDECFRVTVWQRGVGRRRRWRSAVVHDRVGHLWPGRPDATERGSIDSG